MADPRLGCLGARPPSGAGVKAQLKAELKAQIYRRDCPSTGEAASLVIGLSFRDF